MATTLICSSVLYSRILHFPSKMSTPFLQKSLFSSSHTYRRLLPRSINFHAEDPIDPATRFNLNRIFETAHKLFDEMPQPVKKFPWAKTMENYFRLVFNLACAVAKFLSLPILAVSSLSEMSYCGHERKLVFVPFAFLMGFFIAGVLVETAIELSVGVKEGEFPWYLLMVAIFFLLLKLPGPYYPYWGRLIVPHFANGGLWRIVWRVFLWYRRVGMN